jgi:uncharacterized protein (TIGR03437 family)
MRIAVIALGFLGTTAAWAVSTGPGARLTGAAVDGGGTCTNCHRTFPLNPDDRGSVRIETAAYRPGVKQVVRVTVSHPDAIRWGFQLTARRAGEAQVQAGGFDVKTGIRVRCSDPLNGDAPCNAGSQQFAMHNRDSFDKGANGRMTFEVDWTPPADDAGDIVFFAAGNAADGSGNNTGDRIYTTSAIVRNANGCALTAAPAITGVGNAASGRAGMSFGSLVSIYGTGFLPAARARGAQAFELGAGFPTQIECVAVEIGGVRSPLTYASPGQLNVQTPLLELDRPQGVVVVVNPGTANERKSQVSNHDYSTAQPGFFTFNGTSVAALHADNTPVADPTVVPGGRPAKPGDVIVLYGTGFGPTEPIWQPGQIPDSAARTRSPVRVQVGSVILDPLQVDYAGISPGSISGLMQVNIKVPVNLTETGNVTITAGVGNASTQTGATIPVQR